MATKAEYDALSPEQKFDYSQKYWQRLINKTPWHRPGWFGSLRRALVDGE